MKAYEIGEQTGLASLRAVERPDPVPAAGEVVVRVRAACLNHRDLKVLAGTYGPRRPSTRIPVSDGIGEIVALGADVGAPALGTRVICGHFCNWLDGPFSPAAFAHDLGITRDGWLAQGIAVPAAALVTVPDTLSDTQAVALPAAGLTAWNALVEVGRVKAGDTVLLLGTGGVSILALNIARMHGARVAITSSSDAKLAQARAMGADIAINYRDEPDWGNALLRATGGTGADIVVETGGLATLTHSIAACAPNARIVLIGALGDAASAALPNFSSVVGKNLTLRGITAGNRRMLHDLVRAASVNGLAASIHRSFAFDAAPQAYAFLATADHIGKVMIEYPA